MIKFRDGFTIIEVLISVLIISFGIIFILQIDSENENQIIYISKRNKLSLQDSIFLTSNITNYHMDKKSAYDILEKFIKVKKQEGRDILKNSYRDIFIPDPIEIKPPANEKGPVAEINEIMLKDNYSSTYYQFKVKSF